MRTPAEIEQAEAALAAGRAPVSIEGRWKQQTPAEVVEGIRQIAPEVRSYLRRGSLSVLLATEALREANARALRVLELTDLGAIVAPPPLLTFDDKRVERLKAIPERLGGGGPPPVLMLDTNETIDPGPPPILVAEYAHPKRRMRIGPQDVAARFAEVSQTARNRRKRARRAARRRGGR